MRKSFLTAVIASLVLTASAMASGEVPDPCSVAGVGTLPNSTPEPNVPWLDLCDTDITGIASSSTLRGMRVTFHLAGDTDLRASSAAYATYMHVGECYFQLQYSDLGLDSTGNTTRIQGQCNIPPGEPCPVIPACWSSGDDNGEEFDIRGTSALTGSVTPGGLTDSTITLTFDPGKIPAGTAPQALFDALAPGSSITWAEAWSFVRAGAVAVTGQEGAFEMADWAPGDGRSIPLG